MQADFLRILDQLAASMPESPILLLSALAAGADQLAAVWALEWSGRQPRLSDGSSRLMLGVPLPLPADEYRRDFADDSASLALFEDLLSRAAFRTTVPAAANDDGSRDAAYSRLASFLAEQSQTLVAFWDGQRVLRRGGTYHVIEKCRRSDPEAAQLDVPFHRRRHLLMAPNEVDLRLILVKRTGAAAASPPSSEQETRPMTEELWPDAADYRARLDAMNGRLARQEVTSPFYSTSDRVRARFEAIDAMASAVKRDFLRHVKSITLLALVAAACFQVFSFSSRDGWAAFAYVGITLIVFAWYFAVRHFSGVEWAFVYSRGVAEAMRVQLVWSSSGIVDRVAEQYMSRRSMEVAALRRLVAAATVETLSDDAASGAAEMSGDAAAQWIEGQLSYMRRRLVDGNRGRSIADRISSSAISVVRLIVRAQWLIILMTVAALAWATIQPNSGEPRALVDRWMPIGALFIGVLVFLKSGVEYHDNAMLGREDRRRFQRLVPVYDKAAELLARSPSADDRRRVIVALGKEAIDENAEWFEAHSDALQLPTVG
jgi:hypothetical protein